MDFSDLTCSRVVRTWAQKAESELHTWVLTCSTVTSKKDLSIKDLALAKSWRKQTARGKENNKLVTPLQVDVHYMRLTKHS